MNGYLLITVPAAPMIAAILILAGGRRLGNAAGITAVLANAVSLVSLLFLYGAFPLSIAADWGISGGYRLTAGLWLDRLSFFTAVFVSAVGFFVNLYAVGYMAEDDGKSRFFAEMAFFTGAMLTLVLAGSFIILFAAWEWVGLASFLLIGFWYRKTGVPAAAKNAFLITRLGDTGFFIGWLWVLGLTGTTDISVFLETVKAGGIGYGILILLALLFFLGAVGKSAQLPLSAWLPPAMAGPSPVSALIHSATMVAAGVYLLLRLYPLYHSAPLVRDIIFWIGGGTALFAALSATVQADLKRVLAWSTISQLGEMIFAIGLGAPLAAFFHLVVHGVFKAALFLAAGAVEHAAGVRELARLGGLSRKLPVAAGTFAVAGLALAGVPPFSGFFSEDKILADAVARGTGTGIYLLVIVFLAGVYISRAGAAAFGSWPGAPAPPAEKPERSMQAAMIGLAVFAAGVGWALSGTVKHLVPFESGPHLELGWKIAASLIALSGIAFGVFRVYRSGPVPALGGGWKVLERGLNGVTRGAGELFQGAAVAADYIERGLDAGALIVGRVFGMAAGAVNSVEYGVDTGAIAMKRGFGLAAAACDILDIGFDRAARTLARATVLAADGSDRLERSGFSRGGDRLAMLLGMGGSGLRRLQTGRLYLYTLGLFVWGFLVVGFGFIVWVVM